MMWHEHKAYADLICETFTTSEIEALENLADYYCEALDSGRTDRVVFADDTLELEKVWAFEGEDK